MKKILPVIISSLLSAFLAVFIYRQIEEPREVIVHEPAPARYASLGEDPLNDIKPRTFLSSSPTDFIQSAKSVTPAVVNIQTTSEMGDFWHKGVMSTSTGSGVIISKDGYIVTNSHVVEGSTGIEVTLNDNRKFEAEIIGTDASTDLALLRIEGDKLPWIEFGNSDSLQIGEWVIAVGNPFNLESTVTAGIVSAKGRSIDILEGQDRIESFIQTDAAVNPGNSGGALVNTNGELIGINTAIITHSGRYEGYSFAVPANLVRKVIRDLRDYGVVQRGILGVFIAPVDSEMAEELDLPAVEGVYIERVSAQSGADDAGLETGDVIIGINGVKTKSMPEMQEQIGRYRPGNTISVEYIRNGKIKLSEVMLKSKTNDTRLVSASENKLLRDLGFQVRNLTKEEKRALDVEGVKVVSIYRGSKIMRTNMDPEFIITHVNNKKVKNTDKLLQLLESASGKVMLEGIYENYPGEYYYAFSMD
ncbi:MAG: PDZ domain-containing protein [Bacteroidetes bacterium]|nr:MAG: PDZ domain-containing protein [Bacteroidota bacterium]